jgi:hypothetical protein
MKTKELGWRESHGIENIITEDSKGNVIVDETQVLKIWEKYITEFYSQPKQPENLEVEPV